MRQSKSLASNLLVLLNTVLIISTVIVFAVLLFLSYENMNDRLIKSNLDDVDVGCSSLASDLSFAFATDEGEVEREVYRYINSAMYSHLGNIYIVNSDADVIYQCINDYTSALTGYVSQGVYSIRDESALDILSISRDRYIHFTKLTGRNPTIDVSSCTPIEGTEYYCLIVKHADVTSDKQEYLSIILVPGLISMVVAILLFVSFVEIAMRPVKRISQVMGKVAGGDYSARVAEKYAEPNQASALTVSADMSEMAQTLNNMLEVLENQEKDRSIFISSIAHDIRTPLTSINGFVTAMLDGTIPYENQEKYLNLIKNEADRIRRLVNSMTEASSLSHVDPELMEEFNLEEVLDNIFENLIPQTQEKSITLTANLELAGDSMVYGEAQQLCRVLVNIISNAIKFTPVTGSIRVTAIRQESEKNMKILVEDSGSGVDEDKRSRIFESFYKADPSRKQEGFGLGLYICKQILVGHGQTIVVDESKDLGGAAFIFSFPLPPKE